MGLCISRKRGERIFIGDKIILEVADIDRNKVRFYIDAPRDVVIMREELLQEKKEVKRDD